MPTVANLKPVLIDDHPDYASVKAAAVHQGWRGRACSRTILMAWGPISISPIRRTARWWQSRFGAQVLDAGFTAGWNDKNEYEVGRDGSVATGFGQPALMRRRRGPCMALMKTRATFEATQARDESKRPFTITRAGPAGLQRYAET